MKPQAPYQIQPHVVLASIVSVFQYFLLKIDCYIKTQIEKQKQNTDVVVSNKTLNLNKEQQNLKPD
jgi:hypothetical protein